MEAIPEAQRPIKPASQESTFKSIGAMLALEHFGTANPSDPQFGNIGACWVSTLIHRGMVLCCHTTGEYYLSLGSGAHSLSAVGWRLVEVEADVFQIAPPSGVGLQEARDRIQIICLQHVDAINQSAETHSAVPVHVRESLSGFHVCLGRAVF